MREILSKTALRICVVEDQGKIKFTLYTQVDGHEMNLSIADILHSEQILIMIHLSNNGNIQFQYLP